MALDQFGRIRPTDSLHPPLTFPMPNTIRILNVEDNEDDFLLIRREVRRAGITAEFERVESPEALRAALARDVWSVIIADYSLPGFSGIDALQILNETGHDIPFILVSGTVGEDIAVKAMKMGASDYILKGNLARLAPAIEREIREAVIRRERRRAESALKESDDSLRKTVSLLRATIDSTADGILVVGAKGLVTIRNEKFLAISGVKSAMPGAHARQIFTDIISRITVKDGLSELADRLCEHPEEPLDIGGVRTIEFIDDKIVEAYVFPQMLEGRCVGNVISLRDVTARRRSEEARHRIETQLFQSQKMEALGSLAGGVAHDFNNLLSVILNYAELLRMKVGANPDADRYIEHMLKAGQRAAELVRQILLFSRRQKQELRPLCIQDSVEDGVKLIRSTIPRTVEIECTFDASAPPVLADTTQVHQVLMNLCINAAQAMADRTGLIRVNVRHHEVTREEAARIPEGKAGPYVELSVTDNGSGMDRDMLLHIFEPFFTTKSKGEGTGLGLAVVHGIIRSHNGFVSVQSEKGVGTSFRVFIPVYHDGTECRPVPVGVEPQRGSGQSILFVDDEPAICGVTEHVLTNLGYRVRAFVDPLQAVAAFETDPQGYDLLLSDVNMPGMSGVELARRVIERRPGLPVILISGYSGNWTAENLRELGVHELLQKPISPRQIGGHVQRALARPDAPAEPVEPANPPIDSGPAPTLVFGKASFSSK